MAPQLAGTPFSKIVILSEIHFYLFLMVFSTVIVTCYSCQRETKTTSMGPSYSHRLVTAQGSELIGKVPGLIIIGSSCPGAYLA